MQNAEYDLQGMSDMNYRSFFPRPYPSPDIQTRVLTADSECDGGGRKFA